MIYDDMFDPIPAELGQGSQDISQSVPECVGLIPESEQSSPPAPELAKNPPSAPAAPDAPNDDVDLVIEEGFSEPYPEADPDFTPEPPAMRRRFDRHKPFNDIQAAYWMKYIERNPFSFDALLYRAKPIESEATPDGYEPPEFGSVDIRQTDAEYFDPEPVVVLDSPDDSQAFIGMDITGENAIDTGAVLVLQIAAENIPTGSVLEWEEETASGEPRRVWWYVHRAENYGTTKAGTLYYCIPCRTFEGVITDE